MKIVAGVAFNWASPASEGAIDAVALANAVTARLVDVPEGEAAEGGIDDARRITWSVVTKSVEESSVLAGGGTGRQLVGGERVDEESRSDIAIIGDAVVSEPTVWFGCSGTVWIGLSGTPAERGTSNDDSPVLAEPVAGPCRVARLSSSSRCSPSFESRQSSRRRYKLIRLFELS